MSVLTQGLGAPPLGWGTDHMTGGPAPLLTAGMGAKYPETAHPYTFATSTLTVNFHHRPAFDVGTPGAVTLLPAPSGDIDEVKNPHVPDGFYMTRPGHVAYQATLGDNGDVEAAIMTPQPHNRYNARSVTVHLPEGYIFPPRAMDRLVTYLRSLKELTVYTTVRRTKGSELIKLTDLAEETS